MNKKIAGHVQGQSSGKSLVVNWFATHPMVIAVIATILVAILFVILSGGIQTSIQTGTLQR